ncbi:Hybrid signal transduction histidine kinase A [Colletotrichum gloeosporioides]|uniref:Hybrid signal transduction histidine kinase A n=1 Tax=Colletotrichum gloeosporioides TaxID=474922 RepID=A0A8H4CQ47_COLGL|nr:Hybrid signal transduction histidine kinase A [Colletotrichum gloeosporioides]KAF3807899.1 Hybrid signal transduction histidine kinase A [Colletotrichum gloeosporioides]
MVGGKSQASFESARERETFRYDTSLISASRKNDPANLIPPSEIKACPDASLTAFAQLGALRMGASRAMISLFDRKYQYIVAEATPNLLLFPNATTADLDPEERLWLCGTHLPRAHGICESVLLAHSTARHKSSDGDALPVSVIPDLTSDPKFSDKSLSMQWPNPRFYAGVPIKSRRGVSIGVFSVWSADPRQELGFHSTQLLRGLSRMVTDHLDSKRTVQRHHRAVRMLRGMGSFVEGKSTMSKLASQSHTNDQSVEGALNQNQQRLQSNQEEDNAHDDESTPDSATPSTPSPKKSPSLPPQRGHRRPSSPSDDSDDNTLPTTETMTETTSQTSDEEGINHIFSKAANIIRESIEVEGALFLDASIGSFAGLATKTTTSGSFSSSSSSDEHSSGLPSRKTLYNNEADVPCRILGHSNSLTSSIDRQNTPKDQRRFSELFLAKLLRRYPSGRIFAFDENGSLQSTDFSGEDLATPLSPVDEETLSELQMSERSRKRNKKLLSRQNEGKMLMTLFSGARSVALVPLWDAQKQRWYSGGFVYTKTPTRVLTIESELSYLRAFGTVIMSEVAKYNARMVDKAKSDLLSSLSHELRSPLHGILLGAELMQDTNLDAFQGDVLHSVETCGKTLLDTMDHLLDYSKLGNFLRPTTGRRKSTSGMADRGLRNVDKKLTIEAGMMSLSRNVNIDVLAEEVIESVCAGFSFQRFAVSRLTESRPSEHGDIDALHRLDSMQALENMSSETNKGGDSQILLGDVSVTYDVNPAASWRFNTQPGALRRIILNILGNALKYTTRGFVNVNVLQLDSSRPGSREIHIIVTDSGKGMSEDYLRYHLYAPFHQEDNLSAGTGLGLSLVKEVVTRLGGSIQVWSKLNRGTKVTVKLPLQEASTPSPKSSIPKTVNFDEFRAQVSELKGLRVRLLGFSANVGTADDEISANTSSEATLLENICRDWLEMQVIDASSLKRLLPDLILATERNLDRLLFEQRHGSGSTPVVVVCRNALIARQLATSPRFTTRRVVFEFVSQPIGPRKLARILLLSFRRWTRMQASAIKTPTALSLATSEYRDNLDGASALDSLDVRSTAALSKEPAPDDTEYFNIPSLQPAESIDTAKKVDVEHDRTETLPERPVPNGSSTPTPDNREPDESSNNSDNDQNLFLLVDDNAINLKILSEYMKKLGHRYATAMNGKQAVEAFKKSEGRIKCVFMDISMPVMDGFEATREIRVFETRKNIPRCQVFALTGLASASAQEEAFASGIDLFLTKPVKLKELSKIIRTSDIA